MLHVTMIMTLRFRRSIALWARGVQLDRRYPDSLFILTLRRSSQAVAESEMAHWSDLGLDREYLALTGQALTPTMLQDRWGAGQVSNQPANLRSEP